MSPPPDTRQGEGWTREIRRCFRLCHLTSQKGRASTPARVHLVMSGGGSSAISTIHYFSLQRLPLMPRCSLPICLKITDKHCHLRPTAQRRRGVHAWIKAVCLLPAERYHACICMHAHVAGRRGFWGSGGERGAALRPPQARLIDSHEFVS